MRKASIDVAAAGEERRALGDCGPEVGNGRHRDDQRDARILSRGLQRDAGAERHAERDNRPAAELVEGPAEILLFVEPVGAGVAARFAVRAAVVGEHVEPQRIEVLRDRDPRRAVVTQAVKIDDQPSSRVLGSEQPTGQVDAHVQVDLLEFDRRQLGHRPPRRVEQRVRPPGGRHTRRDQRAETDRGQEAEGTNDGAQRRQSTQCAAPGARAAASRRAWAQPRFKTSA